jgi:DNA-binding MarR family transcriptional regulator
MFEGEEKERLKEDIKMRQYQALFYIGKMENLSKQGEIY